MSIFVRVWYNHSMLQTSQTKKETKSIEEIVSKIGKIQREKRPSYDKWLTPKEREKIREENERTAKLPEHERDLS